MIMKMKPAYALIFRYNIAIFYCKVKSETRIINCTQLFPTQHNTHLFFKQEAEKAQKKQLIRISFSFACYCCKNS